MTIRAHIGRAARQFGAFATLRPAISGAPYNPTMLLRRFTRNTAGRDLLVGDIHGFFSKLRASLDAVRFDPERDRLFSVGDLVDRGPESAEVLDWLGKPWFHAIMGNHEEWALLYGQGDAPRVSPAVYAYNGGAWFIGMTAPERIQYLDAFSALPLAIELETDAGLLGLVHGDCPYSHWSQLVGRLTAAEGLAQALRDHSDELLWSRGRADTLDTEPIDGVRAVVVGHTPVERVTSLGNVYFIDTGAWLPRGAPLFPLVDAATLEPVKP